MFFVYGEVRLEYREGKGYRHPREGTWVEDHRQCLRGWIEEDPQRRRQWATLMLRIDDFWPRVEKNRLEVGEEVVFED